MSKAEQRHTEVDFAVKELLGFRSAMRFEGRSHACFPARVAELEVAKLQALQ